MSFFDSLLGGVGFNGEITPRAFRYYVAGRETAAVEGIKTADIITENEIVFSVGGGKIKIYGAKLFITEFGDGKAVVRGDITGVELL